MDIIDIILLRFIQLGCVGSLLVTILLGLNIVAWEPIMIFAPLTITLIISLGVYIILAAMNKL